MTEALEDFIHRLHKRSGFEVVTKSANPKQVRLLGRVPQKHVQAWLVVVRQILLSSEPASWTADISKQYFVRNGKLMFGWRVIIQGDDVAAALQQVAQLAEQTPRPRVMVEEQPLVGRHAPKPGSFKGANTMGSAVVGPKAVQQALNR